MTLRFRGHHPHAIDNKGRLSIPAKFREILKVQYDERLMVSFMDNCLTAYPYSEWVKLEDQFLTFPQHDDDVNGLLRGYISVVEECPLDNQGRILIPPMLRELAGIREKVLILGCLYKIEIWDYDAYKAEVAGKVKEASILSKRLSREYKF